MEEGHKFEAILSYMRPCFKRLELSYTYTCVCTRACMLDTDHQGENLGNEADLGNGSSMAPLITTTKVY